MGPFRLCGSPADATRRLAIGTGADDIDAHPSDAESLDAYVERLAATLGVVVSGPPREQRVRRADGAQTTAVIVRVGTARRSAFGVGMNDRPRHATLQALVCAMNRLHLVTGNPATESS